MSGRRKSVAETYKRLLGVTKQYWLSLLLGMLGTLFISFSDAGFAWLIKPIVNKGFIGRDKSFISWMPILVVMIFFFRAAASFCSSFFVTKVARSVVMDFRQKLFQHLQDLPACFYDQNPSSKLLAVILYNVEQVSQASSDVLVTVLREITLIAALVVVMFVVDWRLSSFFILILPLIAVGVKICSRRLRSLSEGVQASIADLSQIASEGIEAYRVVRVFQAQKFEIKKFNQATKRNYQQELKVEVTNSIGTSVIQLIIAVPLASVLYASTSPTLSVSTGSFTSIITALIMLIRPVRRVSSLNSHIQKGVVGTQSIFELLDEKTERDLGKKSIVRSLGCIEFNKVNFAYARSRSQSAVLTDVSFKVKPSQTVAIVGHSGSGKSTLVSLLPRFYDVSSGMITLDQINIKDYRLADLRQQFAIVSQQTVLFNTTVASNIAYAQGEARDEQRMIQAARSANALGFIERLPQGFDTILGESGSSLSGGQRQRLAIARALYKQAPILILDEATASLDTQSECLIRSALTDLIKSCTTLVIAHRLSTIENADWILVMDSGRIVEAGVHADLIKAQGVYARLHQVQFNPASKTS